MSKNPPLQMHVKPQQVLGYMLLPGILPRIREFVQSGFGWLSYLVAYLYACVRLLPANHPYLNTSNSGRYSIRHVVMEAAGNLQFRRENLDQIVVFFTILAGFVLLALQFVLFVVGFLANPALAMPAGLFMTPNPTNDIAFMLLDKVFAIPNLYGSQYDPGAGGVPAFNAALHNLFRFYNIAILIVGVVIFIYYVIVVVAETATTGTPFGRRFSHVYAPLRLVVAVGLLVPLNYGLNSAQYITLFAAKYGSSLATNAWLTFNTALTDAGNNALGQAGETLLARPTPPEVGNLIQFMSIVLTCAKGYEVQYRDTTPYGTANNLEPINIQPYLVYSAAGSEPIFTQDYDAALALFGNRDLIIRFGHWSTEMFRGKRGYVYPFCGEIRVSVDDVTQIGAQEIQGKYYQLVKDLWSNTRLNEFANRAVAMYLPRAGVQPQDVAVNGDAAGNDRLPVEGWRRQLASETNEGIIAIINQARDDMVAGTNFSTPQELKDRGWGGAAIWYNRIAMWNGALMGAAFNTPAPAAMPTGMQRSEDERRIHNENGDAAKRYEPYISSATNRAVGLEPLEEPIIRMLNEVYQYWRQDGATTSVDNKVSGNIFMDMINAIFPVGALMEIRNNVDVHPLAQLTGLGKSIVDSAVRNLMFGLAFAGLGGMGEMFDPNIGGMLGAISSMFVTLSMFGITIGFILYYVLPFLPFMYFFFAIGNWVKSIFEAMVGVPLWALAHLRIDGQGLPSDAAMNGYFLIFEIFLRPILTLFGLLGGLVIFSALARTLNEIFPLVIMNVTGFDGTEAPAANLAQYKGSVLDEFFYTVIYTMLLYIMATSSFKLIDQIPSQMLRWMSGGVQSFNSQQQDPNDGLVTYAALGAVSMTGKVTGAMTQGARTGGMAVGTAASSLIGRSGSRIAGSSEAGAAARGAGAGPARGADSGGNLPRGR